MKKRDLKDTPFAIERLFVWAVGIYGLIGLLALATIAVIQVLQHKSIYLPPALISITSMCAGGFLARIERGTK